MADMLNKLLDVGAKVYVEADQSEEKFA